MEDCIRINNQLAVGPQPTEEQLKPFAEQGFKSVVNLRMPGEDEQPLSPDQEGDKVRALGMQYLHIPVSKKAMQPEQVAVFARRSGVFLNRCSSTVTWGSELEHLR